MQNAISDCPSKIYPNRNRILAKEEHKKTVTSACAIKKKLATRTTQKQYCHQASPFIHTKASLYQQNHCYLPIIHFYMAKYQQLIF